MSRAETYKTKGVVIDSIIMTNFDSSQTLDISRIFTDFNIYEDMLQSQLTGDISIDDSLELVETFPIIGEETLQIKWHIPGSAVDDYFNSGKLRVYKVANRSASGAKAGKSTSYTLFFVSEEAIININQSISRSFNTKTASQIVSIIYNDYINTDKSIEIEDTEGVLKLVIPNWKPFKAINWLAGNKAINRKSNADFLFFESLNGIKGPKFNFKSLTSLFEQDSIFDIEFKVQNISNGKTKDMSTASHNIDSFHFSKHNDYVDNVVNGLYAQTWIFHDPLRKKFVISKQKFSDAINDGTHDMFSSNLGTEISPLQYIKMPGGVNSFPPSISSSKAINNDISRANELATERKDISYIAERESNDELNCNSLISNIGPKRAFRIQQLNAYKIIFPDIPGTFKIKLGSVVKFNKPHISNDPDQYAHKLGRYDDRFLSGNYLVTRMRHSIGISSEKSEYEYTITLECVKNKFEEKISGKRL